MSLAVLNLDVVGAIVQSIHDIGLQWEHARRGILLKTIEAKGGCSLSSIW